MNGKGAKEDADSAPKRQKFSHDADQDHNQLAVAGPSTERPTPKIFKLDVDCFDEIFEYLSVQDLNSFALTCKAMHKVAGEYFKRNFATSQLFINGYDARLVTLNGYKRFDLPLAFSQFVSRICLKVRGRNDLLYLAFHPNEFKAINFIQLHLKVVDRITVDTIKSHFSKLETLEFYDVRIHVNIYDAILKFCSNLKRLMLHIVRYETEPGHDSWIHQKYPKLTSLILAPIPSIHDLNIFFQNNPSVQTLRLNIKDILRHRNEIINLSVQLNVLNVDTDIDSFKIEFIDLLNRLHEQRFYKSLGLFVHDRYSVIFNDNIRAGLASLCDLKQLRIKSMRPLNNDFPYLHNLHTLEILNRSNFFLEPNVIARKYVNLERLHIQMAHYGTFLACIQQLPKLKMLKLDRIFDVNVNLITLNKEREKLLGAQKLTIYVTDEVFIHNKWKIGNGDINLKIIEMKRIDSCPWQLYDY